MSTEKKTPAKASAKAFDAFIERRTAKASDGGPPPALKRRQATVTIQHDICEPGAFDAPFELTLEGLSPKDELEAMGAAGDKGGAGMAFLMAKRSVKAFAGRPLRNWEVDLLWESLGFAGRAAVSSAFMEHCTGVQNEASLGNSLGVEIG